jgi:hypothetical protein
LRSVSGPMRRGLKGPGVLTGLSGLGMAFMEMGLKARRRLHSEVAASMHIVRTD